MGSGHLARRGNTPHRMHRGTSSWASRHRGIVASRHHGIIDPTGRVEFSASIPLDGDSLTLSTRTSKQHPPIAIPDWIFHLTYSPPTTCITCACPCVLGLGSWVLALGFRFSVRNSGLLWGRIPRGAKPYWHRLRGLRDATGGLRIADFGLRIRFILD
jgi:hypothetical protein